MTVLSKKPDDTLLKRSRSRQNSSYSPVSISCVHSKTLSFSRFFIRRFQSAAVSRRKNMVNFCKHSTAKVYDLRSAISPPKIIQIFCRTSRSEEHLLPFLLLFKFWTAFLVSSFYLSVNIIVFYFSICIVTMSPCHSASNSGLCHFK